MNLELIEFTDYRSYLSHLLEHRSNSNRHYSLRSFARDLSVSPGQLSKVLSGKRGISHETAIELSDRLNLTEGDTAYFCDLVQSVHARTEKAQQIAKARCHAHRHIPNFQIVQLDLFKIVSDWYHFAILELTFFDDFENNNDWIADKLDITVQEVDIAVKRLIRIGLLEEIDGVLRKKVDSIDTPPELQNEAIQKVNEQLLDKAKESIRNQAPSNRLLSTITMAIDKSKLKDARKLIIDFKYKLSEFLTGDKKESVYCFSTQLFELTTNDNDDKSRRLQ